MSDFASKIRQLSILGALIISNWLLCDVDVHDNWNRSNLYLAYIMYMNPTSTYAKKFSSIPLLLKMCFFICHYPASTAATKWFHQSTFRLHNKICKWILLLLTKRFLLKSSFYLRYSIFWSIQLLVTHWTSSFIQLIFETWNSFSNPTSITHKFYQIIMGHVLALKPCYN